MNGLQKPLTFISSLGQRPSSGLHGFHMRFGGASSPSGSALYWH
jgi:hypothetical protein